MEPTLLIQPSAEAPPPTQTQAAAQEAFMSTLRELVLAYQAYSAYSERHIRQLGLTPCQFDVLSTLGNTLGMSMNKLAEKTLVTKGTLTGIVDRLEQKGLVQRQVPPDNRRCFMIVLTPAGQQTFERVFPAHIAHLKQCFDQLQPEVLAELGLGLKRLREQF